MFSVLCIYSLICVILDRNGINLYALILSLRVLSFSVHHNTSSTKKATADAKRDLCVLHIY